MQLVFVVLLALATCIAANGGQGGKGGFKLPQSCKDDGEAIKKCYEDFLSGKSVNIKVEEVMKCFKSCPHNSTGGHHKGRGKGDNSSNSTDDEPRQHKGWGKGDDSSNSTDDEPRQHKGWGKGDDSSNSTGQWAQSKAVFKALHQCIEGKMGDKFKTCFDGKITFPFAEPEADENNKTEHGGRKHGMQHGKQHGMQHGKQQAGAHNPLTGLKDKVAACGAETETCVRAAMGDWYDKTDQLSQILCDASTACPFNKSSQCETELKAVKDAKCSCKESLKADFEQAKKDCTTDDNRDAIDRLAKRTGGAQKGQKDECAADNDAKDADNGDKDKREHQSPFCAAAAPVPLPAPVQTNA